MNKILKVLALVAMALSTIACSDFLEVNPRTQVSETGGGMGYGQNTMPSTIYHMFACQ